MDEFLRTWVVTHRVGVLNTPMWLLSVVGRGGAIFIVIGLVLFLARRCSVRSLLELLLAILVATTIADYVLKPLIARERPYLRASKYQTIGRLPSTSSFPSGHTANAVAGAMVLAAIVPGGRVIWWALAAGIAYSRLYLGVHYPLDVLGGAVVGFVAAMLVAFSIRKTEPVS